MSEAPSAFLVVGIEAGLRRPAVETLGERRERPLPDALVEPPPEPNPVIAGLLLQGGEAALREGLRGEEGEERARLGGERLFVQPQPLERRRR